MHCGKDSTRKFTSSQSNVGKYVIYSICWAWISSCGYMLMIFLRPGIFSKIRTFPQCTPYMYILIYIKGSNLLQTAVYIYILVHGSRLRMIWLNQDNSQILKCRPLITNESSRKVRTFGCVRIVAEQSRLSFPLLCYWNFMLNSEETETWQWKGKTKIETNTL